MTLLLGLLLAVAAPEVEVRTLAGERVVGQLQSLSPDRVAVQTAAGPVEFDAARLLSLTKVPAAAPAANPTASPVLVELAGGSRLLASDFRVAGKTAHLALPSGELELDLGQVTAVRFSPASPEFDAVWAEAIADTSANDRLVLQKKDKVDLVLGVVHDIDGQNVQFDLGGLKPVKRERVLGIVYYRSTQQAAPKIAGIVLDRGGAAWAATRVELTGDLLRLEMAGQTREIPWADVQSIDYSAGKIQRLGAPETKEWTPYLGAAADLGGLAAMFAPRVDSGFDGGPLILGGKEYTQGLALRSRSRVSYRLPPGARRFQATAGIDDRYAARGHVQLQVRADGRTVFDEPVAGGDAPRALDLEIAGARRLEIVVDFGQGGDLADHLNLCEARVTQ